MQDVSLDLQPPILHVARGVAQRFERNANLDFETPWRHMPLRLPEKVGAEIVLTRHHVRAGNEATRFALRPICLDAEGVDDENERSALVVKRIQVDLDVVV